MQFKLNVVKIKIPDFLLLVWLCGTIWTLKEQQSSFPLRSKQSGDNAGWSQLPATVQMGRHERKIEIADPISHSQYCTAASEKFLDKDALLFRVRARQKMIQFALSVRSAEAAL